jgi:glycosyltransferase involved in cell wall biosynthesis
MNSVVSRTTIPIVQPFDFQSSVFGNKVSIPTTAKVIFVADMFVEDYVGGAELTSEAIISSSPFEVFKLHSRDVTMDLLREGHERFWIFGNFCEMNASLIPSIVANLKYSIVEYDYKYCRARSPEKHQHASGSPCDCPDQPNGKMISAFFFGAMGLWWMSEAQKARYHAVFPFLADKDNIVLSSVFDDRTLGLLKVLRNEGPRAGWIVLGSSSWIKGADDAEAWCKANGKEYDVVWNLPYDQLLQKLARAEGFVYLPKGGDTCPRMVIEAKLLGCKLHLNANVQHASEEWFTTDDLEAIESYLYAARSLFWNGTKSMMEYRPTISGYTTTYNAHKQQYPVIQCIKSMLQFCDEVCVVDGGSTDATIDLLVDLAYPGARVTTVEDIRLCCTIEDFEFPLELDGIKRDPRIKVKVVKRDWSAKRHPVFDGMQKAEARKMCTSEFCWQMDADEVVHEDDAPKVGDLCRGMPRNVGLVALPVIEYWGGPEKVRLDITPWKWRLSRNLPHITHGIPVALRMTDADGQPYAKPGTDGCDMIHAVTGEPIPFIGFYTAEAENARVHAMGGNEQARREYEAWFNQITSQVPGVFHYSWYDLPRKIRLYRDYWQNHWEALWNRDTSDTAENNLMFGVPWKDVTDQMIADRAAEMKNKLGGWIWHRAWDGKATTPHIHSTRTQPKAMQ